MAKPKKHGLKASMLGTPSAIDQYNESWQTSSKCVFTGSGITGIKLWATDNFVPYKCIFHIDIYVGGVLWKTLKANGGNTFWRTCGYFMLVNPSESNRDGCPSEVTLNLNAYEQYYGGNPYGATSPETKNASLKFDTAGSKKITIKVWHLFMDSLPSHGENWTAGGCDEIEIGSVEVKAPLLVDAITVGGTMRRDWYAGEYDSFSAAGAVVTANFKYQVSMSNAYQGEVTGFSATPPKAAFDTAALPSTHTVTSDTVIIRYAGAMTSYTINVHGVKDFVTETVKSPRDTSVFRIGESYAIAKSKVTYTNDVEESIDVSVSGFDSSDDNIGTHEATYTLSIPKVGTQRVWRLNYEVVELNSVSINASGATKDFDMDDTLTAAGIVVTANYGEDDGEGGYAGGSETIYLDNEHLSITFPEKSVGPDQDVTIEYDDGYNTASATYKININGLCDMDADASAYGGFIRVAKNGAVAYGDVKFKVRRYVAGELTAWTASDLPPITAGEVDTSVAGDTTITFYATEDGATVSADVDVVVYELSELTVTNTPKKTFYEGTDYPVIDLSKFRVVATTSDGQEVELAYNAVNDGYEVLIDGVAQADDEVTLSETKTVTVRAKSEQSVTAEVEIEVEQKAAKSGGKLQVSGSLVYAEVGKTIDLSGFVVLQEMNDGSFERIYDYTCVISGKQGLVFDSDDNMGDTYDLVFSKSPSESATVEDAVMLNGVESIDMEPLTRTVYDVGEIFDPSTVRYTVNYYYGESATGQSGVDSARSTAFVLSEAGSSTAGEVEISLTIKGFSKTVTVYVRKVVLLEKVHDWASPNFSYKIHESLSPESNGYHFRKRYNHKSDGVNWDTADVPTDKVIFTFVGGGTGCTAKDLIPTTSSPSITVTAAYGENGALGSVSYSISVLALKQVKLIDENATEVTKIYMDKGSRLDLTGMRLYVQLNDGTSETKALTDSSAMSPGNGTIISNKVAAATITYTYVAGNSMSATYVIHVHYVSAVTTNLSSQVSSTYYVGDTLDLSLVTASRTHSSSDENEDGYPYTEDIDHDDIQFVLNGMNIGDSYQFITSGDYSVSFADSGIAKSAAFTVSPVVLTSITKTTSNIFKPLSTYVEGQRLDLTGLTITKNYNNGNTVDLAYSDANVQIVDQDGEPFSKTKEIALADDDVEIFAKVVENGVTETVSLGQLSVAANELDSIEVASSSGHQTTFTYGDRFSIDNLVIKANYTNGSSTNPRYSELTITGATVGHEFNPTDDSTFGSITIGVSFTHGGITKTTSYSIALAKPVLASIRTNAATDAVVTQFTDGDAYTESGLTVTGTFANGWEREIASTYWSTNATSVLTIVNNHISMTGDYGAKTITVSCANPYDSDQTPAITATYTVDILSSGAIVSAILMFDEGVDYAQYTVGDTYDAKGAYFHITDIDGNESDVRSFYTSLAKGTVLRSAQRIEVTCTYTKGSFSQSATYKIIVSVANVVSFTETNDYKLAIGKMDGTLFAQLTHDEQTIKFGKTYDSSNNVTGEYYPLFHEDKVQVDDNSAHSATYGYNVYTGADAEGDCIGYIDLGVTAIDGTVVRQAHVILFDDPLNPIDGQGNIEVKFPHYVDGYAERINKCRFGIVYNNRLFVSGNPDYKSCDWHSGIVNVSQEEAYDRNTDLDFTYFSDLDYCFYGTDDSAIVGYDIYRDGDLIVVKEGSDFQATLYRRSYKLIAATAYDGSDASTDNSLAEEAFPMFDINANGGVGGLSHRSIANFVGETLILTKDGIKAVTNKENVYNAAKYTFDVSSYINPRIKGENLKDAIMYAFGEKVLLRTDRGVYVGYNELRNESGEYEWYFISGFDADAFFSYDDELYFANDEGNVYRFPTESRKFVDKDRRFVGEGGTYLTLDDANDKIIASNAYADAIIEGKAFHLLTRFNVGGAVVSSQVHASLGKFVNANVRANALANGASFDDTEWSGTFDPETGFVTVAKRLANGSLDDSETLAIQDLFYDGRAIRCDLIQDHSGALQAFSDYFLHKEADNVYSIRDEAGSQVSLAQVDSFRMCFVVNDLAVTYITDVSEGAVEGSKEFRLLGDHSRKLDLVYYNNQNGYYSGVVTAENNVQSFFVTAPYAMGSIALAKTVWSWIIANDTNLASYMDVGYVSSRKQGGFETIVKSTPASRKFNFEAYDFSKVSFLNDSLPHVYAKYRTLPSVNFIRFAFKNEGDTNMALTALEIIYTVSGFAKGAK